ncbi:MAG TPA: PQQ-binding-like beta-propeller repeat protein [Schlesneria sp.]
MLLPMILLSLIGSGDWPKFRGPNADAHVVGMTVPLEWSDTKNVEWKSDLPGLGWSSPVIVDGRIYLTTAVVKDPDMSLRTMAIDAANGKVIWDQEVRSVPQIPSIHVKNSHASPTPIVHEGSVFVHFGNYGMARLKAADGTIEWTCFDIDYNPVHGSGGTPVLCRGKLVVSCDGSKDPFVIGVDANTGKIAWKTPRSTFGSPSHSFGTSTVAEVNGKPQVLSPGPGMFAAYDPDTGAELWKVVTSGWSIVPQPALGFGMVFYNHDYDHPEVLAVKLGGKGDVTDKSIVWRMKPGAPSTPSPLLVGEELYTVSDRGVATCVNAKTGERYWTGRLGGNYSSSPVYVNDRILFMDEDGTATWVKRGTEFEVLGQNTVPGRTFATPAFSKGAMYLRTDTALYKIAEK